MIKYIFILFIFLFSCSPQKRLEKLIKNHPYLFENEKIEVIDTIITPERKIDTLIILKNNYDTIFIDTNKIKLNIYKLKDTLKIKLISKSDTIIKTKYIDKYIHIKPSCVTNKWFYIFLGFVSAIILIIILK